VKILKKASKKFQKVIDGVLVDKVSVN